MTRPRSTIVARFVPLRLDAQPLVYTGGIPNLGISGGGAGRVPGEDWKEFKEDFATGPLDIVALGSFLQSHGFQVGEHPAFGGVAPVHTDGSWHYRAGAIDVNFGAGESPGEKAAITPLVSHISEMGYGVIWLSEGHFDHAHFDLGGARAGIVGDFAGSMYGPSAFEISFIPTED